MATSQKERGPDVQYRNRDVAHRDRDLSPCSLAGRGAGCSLGQPRTGRQLPGCAKGLVRQRQLPASWQVKREESKFANKALWLKQ